MGVNNEVQGSNTYTHISPLFKEISHIPNELSKIIHTDNLETVNMQDNIKQSNNPLEEIECIDCRLGSCTKHKINMIGGGTGAAQIGYTSLKRTKGTKTWSLNKNDELAFDTLMSKYFMDYYSKYPATLHSHDITGKLTLDKINTPDKLKENVSCGALKNIFRGALFDEQYELKIKEEDLRPLLDIYNITIEKGKVTYIDNKEPHQATHGIFIDNENISYEDIPLYSNQEEIIKNLPTNYVTTINNKVDKQSAYVLDYKVSHMLLQMYMYNFIDYLRDQNDSGLTIVLKKIVVGNNLANESSNISEDQIYEGYKKILAKKLSNQLERLRYNTALNVARLKEILEQNPENLIRYKQDTLIKINSAA